MTADTNPFVRGMSRAGRAVGLLSRALLPIGGGLAGGALIASSIRGMESFNRAMNRSTAIMGDLSDGMRRQLRDAAIETAKTTVFSAEQAAESFYFLASAGLTAQQSLAALPLVAQFAQAGMFDMARATDLLTDAQSALGLTVDDAQQNMLNMRRVSDAFIKAATLSNATVEQFSEALTNKAGTAMRRLNIEIEEGLAVLAVFADQGIKGAEAGTALNIVLRDLTTKAINNAAAFERFGVRVFDSTGQIRNIGAVIRDLETALDGMSHAQAKATLLQLGFTDKSIAYIQSLIGMSDEIGAYEDQLNDAGGATQEVADKQMTDMEKATNRLSGSWTDFTTGMETGALPMITNAIASVVDWADRMNILTGIVEGFGVVWAFLETITALAVSDIASALSTLVNGFIKVMDFFGSATDGMREFAEDMEFFAKGAQQAVIEKNDEMIRKWEMLGTIQEDAADKTNNNADAFNNVADAADDAADALGDNNDAMDKNIGKAQELIETLEKQIATFGMSASEAELFEIGIENLTEAELEQIRALQQQLDELEKQRDLQRDAERVFDATRTPLEKYNEEIEKLKELLERELIDQETFDRAMEQAKRRLEDAERALNPEEPVKTQDPGEFRQVRLSRLALDGAAGAGSKDVKQRDQMIELLRSLRQKLDNPEPVPLVMN